MEEPADREAYIKLANYPLIKHTDMESEMRTEAVEICTGAIEKFPGNQEKSAQLIKARAVGGMGWDGMGWRGGTPAQFFPRVCVFSASLSALFTHTSG